MKMGAKRKKFYLTHKSAPLKHCS